jgi:dTDP-4-dehydrorhamnose reductase
MKILITGVNGMIGSALYRILSDNRVNSVYGVMRRSSEKFNFPEALHDKLFFSEESDVLETITRVMHDLRPDVVINCIGITKHLEASENPILTIPINSVLPHHISHLVKKTGGRFVQISTDCVFSGRKGNYNELDLPDAAELYGRSKVLGEVFDDHCLTIRTSTIGHEFGTSRGLLEWFLKQEGSCQGFSRAYFSGLPTVVLAEVIDKFVLSNNDLRGLYHISASKISKLDLLDLIRKKYNKVIDILEDSSLEIDRSLDSGKFFESTGFVANSWEEMINLMYTDYLKNIKNV